MDPWVPSFSYFKIKTQPPPNCDKFRVVEIIRPNTRIWDEAFIRSNFSSDEQEAILRIPIVALGRRDKFIWHFDQSGRFLVKSTYKLHCNEKDNQIVQEPSTSSRDSSQLWKLIWQLQVSPKIQSFLWRLCTNSIACQGNLRRRGLSIDPTCPLCQNDIETIEHLLFFCPHAHQTWFMSNLGYTPQR